MTPEVLAAAQGRDRIDPLPDAAFLKPAAPAVRSFEEMAGG